MRWDVYNDRPSHLQLLQEHVATVQACCVEMVTRSSAPVPFCASTACLAGHTRFFIQTLTSAPYEVHYNSNRLGIRLTGPRPKFAREDGGEGGGHPSNVHDHVYALGTINMSGVVQIGQWLRGVR
jgi:allophanate hydrolase subunit 2